MEGKTARNTGEKIGSGGRGLLGGYVVEVMWVQRKGSALETARGKVIGSRKLHSIELHGKERES